MLRLNSQQAFVRPVFVTLLICGFTNTITAAQERAVAQAGQPQVSKELWKLLSDWSEASSRVEKLSGEHQRHTYNKPFGVEKIAKGKFWHESPDKGRIDVFPIKITPQMIADRQKPGAQVQMKDGKPFKLQSDDQERWICDGTKVYDINDEQKTARVVHLPPQVRGKNIMNSPLPFLFGMPPDKAVQRFNMKIIKDWRPEYNVVRLEALPRMREDAQNWSKAEIFLDTSTFLPSAVKLVDPAKTTDTVYKFSEMQVNKNGFIERMLGKNPWDPKLGRDYDIHLIQPGQPQAGQELPANAKPNANPKMAAKAAVVPDVVGQDHITATKMLTAAGVAKENIKRLNAGPAPKDNLTYIVVAQSPQPNTPISQAKGVVLKIYDKAQPNAAVGQRRTSQVAQNR